MSDERYYLHPVKQNRGVQDCGFNIVRMECEESNFRLFTVDLMA
jgi:hypothetical protein